MGTSQSKEPYTTLDFGRYRSARDYVKDEGVDFDRNIEAPYREREIRKRNRASDSEVGRAMTGYYSAHPAVELYERARRGEPTNVGSINRRGRDIPDYDIPGVFRGGRPSRGPLSYR